MPGRVCRCAANSAAELVVMTHFSAPVNATFSIYFLLDVGTCRLRGELTRQIFSLLSRYSCKLLWLIRGYFSAVAHSAPTVLYGLRSGRPLVHPAFEVVHTLRWNLQ
jgi:hypothetical protein